MLPILKLRLLGPGEDVFVSAMQNNDKQRRRHKFHKHESSSSRNLLDSAGRRAKNFYTRYGDYVLRR